MSTKTCYYHENKSALSSCERCNRPVCSECVFTLQGELYPLYDKNEALTNYSDYKSWIEELHWCNYCYFDHFLRQNNENKKFIQLILNSLFISAFLSVGITLIIFLLVNFLISSITPEILAFLFCIIMIPIFFARFKEDQKNTSIKEEKFSKIKLTIFNELNLKDNYFPIDCYYCGEIIKPESLTCLNIDCSLDEEIDKNAKIVKVEPIKVNFGIFDGLNDLTNEPPED